MDILSVQQLKYERQRRQLRSIWMVFTQQWQIPTDMNMSPLFMSDLKIYKFHLAGQVILTDFSENLHMKKIDMHRYLQLNC